MMLSDVCLSVLLSDAYIRLAGSVCGRPAGWHVLAHWARLKADTACFLCRLGRGCCQAGPFLGQPIGLFIYIFITRFCAASAECRASSDVAISADQSVSQ